MSKFLAIQNSQRFAFDMLAQPVVGPNKNVKNKYYTDPKNITVPAKLIQEQQLTNGTNVYTFDFSSQAPQPSAILNNILLGKNQVAAVYGIQFYLGVGSTASNRTYYTYGPLAADNIFYNGNTKIVYEQSSFIVNVSNDEYYKYDGINRDQDDGLVLIQPLRVISGELGINQVVVSLPSVSSLTFTSNLFMSCRLHIALGQAQG